MNEQTFLISQDEQSFIALSEKLRCSLESKLDDLFQKHRFSSYFNKSYSFPTVANDEEQLTKSIIGAINDNKVFACSVRKAATTWYGMYYDDRMSVIEKFYFRFKRLSNQKDFLPTINISFVFSKVLITELATILNDTTWRPIRLHYRQSNKGDIQ
jgi:hypothetical protein